MLERTRCCYQLYFQKVVPITILLYRDKELLKSYRYVAVVSKLHKWSNLNIPDRRGYHRYPAGLTALKSNMRTSGRLRWCRECIHAIRCTSSKATISMLYVGYIDEGVTYGSAVMSFAGVSSATALKHGIAELPENLLESSERRMCLVMLLPSLYGSQAQARLLQPSPVHLLRWWQCHQGFRGRGWRWQRQ